MFDCVGSKLQTIAKVFCWVGIGLSLLFGFITMLSESTALIFETLYGKNSNANTIVGLIIIALGSVGSWISSLILYGFGELVENSERTIYYQEILERNSTKAVMQNSRLIEDTDKILKSVNAKQEEGK